MSIIKIIAIGDSLTYGFPYGPAYSWFNLSAEQLHIDYVNQGSNGDTTEGMLMRFRYDVLEYAPTHVIIMGGTNDAYSGYEVGQVLGNVRDMSKMALENGVIPIIGLPIPCNESVEESLLGQYRKKVRAFAASKGLDVIDFYSAMVDERGTKIRAGLYCDGVHPNMEGYEVMTKAAFEILHKVTKKQ